MSSTCQSDHLGRLLGQCEHRMRMVMDRSLRQYGVTPVQCRALMYLHRQPEPVTQRQLEQAATSGGEDPMITYSKMKADKMGGK